MIGVLFNGMVPECHGSVSCVLLEYARSVKIVIKIGGGTVHVPYTTTKASLSADS